MPPELAEGALHAMIEEVGAEKVDSNTARESVSGDDSYDEIAVQMLRNGTCQRHSQEVLSAAGIEPPSATPSEGAIWERGANVAASELHTR